MSQAVRPICQYRVPDQVGSVSSTNLKLEGNVGTFPAEPTSKRRIAVLPVAKLVAVNVVAADNTTDIIGMSISITVVMVSALGKKDEYVPEIEVMFCNFCASVITEVDAILIAISYTPFSVP